MVFAPPVPWVALLLSPAWSASGEDRDGDGILNPVDACRKEPETRNGFQDADGCPDKVPRIRFVPVHEGAAQADAVLLVQSSTTGDQWVTGGFEAESLPGEVWNVQARRGSCLTGSVRTVSGDADRTLEIPLVMNEAASVIVDAVAPDGGWQPGVVARYENADPSCPSATFPVERDAAHKLAAGTYTAHLTAPGSAPHRWTIDLAEGREVHLSARFGMAQRLVVEARDARVWVPFPASSWMRPTDPAIAELPPGTELRVEAPGFRATTVVLNGETPVPLEPAGPSGRRSTVVLLASTSDDLALDGQPVSPSAEGSAIVGVEPGKHEIEIEGGGRASVVEVVVEAGTVLYLRDRARPHVILYPRDRAVPDRAGFALLDRLARQRGRYRYQVVPYIPREGNPDFDGKLATQRAQVILEALVASGVPPEQVEVAALHAPYEGTPEEQRRVEVLPLPL